MEDLIKRSDVWNITAILHSEFITIEQEQILERIDEMVDGLPSADRPQGEWIDAEIPLECGGSMPIQVCNLCKTFYPLAYTGGGHRFCPNCGARMRGADDEASD